jgi:molybdate-binding protein
MDDLLSRAGLSLESLAVVSRMALTETDIAAAVADGEADCGLAVGAVARRFGLDFVPLERERFDLALRRRSYFEAPLQRLFGFVRTDRFRRQAEALGSYDVSGTGAVEFNA